MSLEQLVPEVVTLTDRMGPVSSKEPIHERAVVHAGAGYGQERSGYPPDIGCQTRA
jgi:hypothetical protein